VLIVESRAKIAGPVVPIKLLLVKYTSSNNVEVWGRTQPPNIDWEGLREEPQAIAYSNEYHSFGLFWLKFLLENTFLNYCKCFVCPEVFALNFPLCFDAVRLFDFFQNLSIKFSTVLVIKQASLNFLPNT